ncbi:hypothetical protein Tco_1406038 [Tanacetum coccineum]
MEASTSKPADTSRVKIKEEPIKDPVKNRSKSKIKKQLPRFKCMKIFALSMVVNEAWLASNEKYPQSKAEKDAKQKKKM